MACTRRLLCLMTLMAASAMNVAQSSQDSPTISNVPAVMREVEGTGSGVRGVWSFAGREGRGRWNNGTVGRLTVERFDEAEVVIRRIDPLGASAGTTAVYRGTLRGNRIDGQMSWSAGSKSGSAQWAATVGCDDNSTAVQPNDALARGEQARNNRDVLGVECWWALAASQGSVKGKVKLGQLLLLQAPANVTQDFEAGIQLLREARLADPEAAFFLGMAYEFGRYAPNAEPNPEKARSCFRDAADRGYGKADEFCVCMDQQTSTAMEELLGDADQDPVILNTKLALAITTNLRAIRSAPKTFDVGPPEDYSSTVFVCTASFKSLREVEPAINDERTKQDILGMKAILPPEFWSMPFIQSFVVTRDPHPGDYVVSLGKLGYIGSPTRLTPLSQTYKRTVRNVSCKATVLKPPTCDAAFAEKAPPKPLVSPPRVSGPSDGTGQGPASPLSSGCSSEGTVKSLRGDEPVSIRIRNDSGQSLQVFWIDYLGKRDFRGKLGPGQSILQPTFATHPWLLADGNGVCRRLTVVNKNTQEVSMRNIRP